jgi:hypothetical protein
MLNSILDNIKLERAKFARDVEYLTEMAIEDEVDDILEAAEEEVLGTLETSDMLLEAAAELDKISDEDTEFSNAEIQRIMEATEDMTFDEMIDLDSFVERV